MECAECGTQNREGGRFCLSCGSPLTHRCDACGTELPPGARFCDGCGAAVGEAPVEAAPKVEGARKVVTLVFADLAGSTSLQERMDAESVRRVMDRFYDAMRSSVSSHSGTVVKFMGDGLMAAFGVPTVAEDDAVRAVRAAAAMQDAFVAVAEEVAREWDAEVGLRVGVNTGEVVVAEGEDDVVGDAVNVAARLEHAAGEGHVLVGQETWRLTRDLFTFEEVPALDLKGKAERVPGYRLVSLTPPAAEGLSPFVGRDRELARLTQAFEAAVEARRAHLVTVVGSPGLGKSRLVRELVRRVGARARTFEGQCEASGASTFAPVADVLRQAAGIEETASAEEAVEALAALFPDDDGDSGRITAAATTALGVGGAASPEETFWAVRRVVEQVAARQPAIVVFDDVHWAEPLLLDLLDHLAEWTRDAPVLLVALARPEIREVRPALADAAGTPTDVLVLDALPDEEGIRLASEFLEGHPVDDDVAARLLASAEGNPLFLRELVKMLLEDGVLRLEGGVWVTAEGADVDVPPTIHALLSARIERLEADDRSVVERASVVGHQFFRGAVAVLSPPAVAARIDSHLETLRRKEVVEPEGTYWIDEPVFRFHHALIRDAAYRRLLKESRAELHEQVAQWLAAKAGDLVGEHEEAVGYHLEQAFEYRRDLGQAEPARELGVEAAGHLAAAARRSLDRDDLRAAAGLMGRAVACLPPDDTSRAELLVDRCEALLGLGEVAAGREALAELEAVSGGSPRLAAWTEAFAAEVASVSEPETLPEWVGRAAAAADRLDELGDPVGAAKSAAVHASILARLGQVGACEAALDRALAAAREAGDRRRANGVLAGAPLAALWGPSPVTRAAGRCLDVVRVLRITTDSPPVEAVALRAQGVLEAFRGRFDAARRLVGASRRTLEELGLRHGILQTDFFAGLVELAADDARAAEAHLRTAYEGFRALGVGVDTAQAAALLARACLAQGRDDEALELTQESERLGGHDLKTAIAWRAVRAEALAARGQGDEALRLARDAVAIAAETDALVDHADARLALATVLGAGGDGDGAAAEARRAAELYEAKGATALAERAQQIAGGPAHHAPSGEIDERERAEAGLANLEVEERGRGDESTLANAVTAVWDRYRTLFPDHDVDGILTTVAPDYHLDERQLHAQHATIGRDGFRDVLTELFRGDFRSVDTEVLAIRGDHLALVRVVWHIRARSGGEAEVVHLRVDEADAEGVLTSSVVFDAGDLEAAYDELDRRFDELTGGTPHDLHADSLAVRAWERGWRATEAGDLDGLLALMADDVTYEERTRTSGLFEPLRGKDALGELYSIVFTGRIHFTDLEVLATRGTRLVLTKGVFSWTDDLGQTTEHRHLRLDETDEDGLIVASILFEADDLDAALDELDARFSAQLDPACRPIIDASSANRRAYNARDFEAMRSLLAAEFVLVDHRTTGWGRLDADAYIDTLRGFLPLAPDVVMYSVDAGLVEPDRVLGRMVSRGTDAGGGPFEVAIDFLGHFAEGRFHGVELFDPSQRVETLARLDAPVGEVPDELGTGNLAAAAWDRYVDLVAEKDFDGILALQSPDYVIDQRIRSVLTVHQGREEIRSVLEAVFDSAHRLEYEVLATRGRQLALVRAVEHARDELGGDAELEWIQVDETDENGLMVASVFFDVDDLDVAMDELDDRHLGQVDPSCALLVKVASANQRAANARDWEAMLSTVTDDFKLVDHRLAGFGERDATQWIEGIQAMFEMAPDVMAITEAVIRVAPNAILSRTKTSGSDRQGGRFEQVIDSLGILREGRLRSIELFDPAQEARALARFDEVAAEALDELGADNLAVAAWRRFAPLVEAQDFDAMASHYAPEYVVEGRNRAALTRHDGRDAILEIIEVIFGATERLDYEPLATRGRRLALGRVLEHLRDELGGDAEHEWLQVDETDEAGLMVRSVTFDPDDLDAAMDELDERFLAHADPACLPVLEVVTTNRRAYNARDWEAFRSTLADDLVLEDHRPGWFGELGRDDYVERIRALVELSADARMIISEIFRVAPHAIAGQFNIRGSDPEGGTFEIVIDVVSSLADGRFGRIEFFDPARRSEAVARFDELTGRRDESALMNSAVRQTLVANERLAARDLDGVFELYADDVVTEERRHSSHEVSDGQALREWIGWAFENFRFTAVEFEPVAIRGDALALGRQTFRVTDEAGGQHELNWLQLVELDEDGLTSRFVLFELDDLDAAFDELDARYRAQVGPGCAPYLDLVERLDVAHRNWDVAAYRSLLADDFVAVDHRLAGWGELGADDYCTHLAGLFELTDEVTSRQVEQEVTPTGGFGRTSVVASGLEGGPVEITFFAVGFIENGRFTRMELFPLEARAAARARFEELVAETSDDHGDGNLALQAWEEAKVSLLTGAVDPILARLADDVSYEERRGTPGRFTLAGRSALAEMLTTMARNPPGSIDTEVVATRGGHLALTQNVVHMTDHRVAGDYESTVLRLDEVDDAGRFAATVVFGPEDLAAAFDELDERFRASLAEAHRAVFDHIVAARQAYNAHDWGAVRSLLTEDFFLLDHRPGWFGTLDRDGYLERLEGLVTVAPDASIAVADIPRLSADTAMIRWITQGTGPEGGPVEIMFDSVATWSGDRVRRFEFFPVEEREEALKRFEDLASLEDAGAAVRTWDRVVGALRRNDVDSIVGLIGPDYRDHDHVLDLVTDREEQIRNQNFVAAGKGLSIEWGRALDLDRVGVVRVRYRWSAGGGSGVWRVSGSGEFDSVMIVVLDDAGQIVETHRFADDQLHRALVLAEERHAEIASDPDDAAASRRFARMWNLVDAYNRGDWDGVREMWADGLVTVDHRPAGWGTVEGRDRYVEVLEGLAEVTRDRRWIVHDLLHRGDQALAARWSVTGTDEEGGPFEMLLLVAFAFDADGRVIRQEIFPDNGSDEVLAAARSLEGEDR